MNKKGLNKKNVLNGLMAPLSFVFNVFKNIIKWFSLGFFKTITFIAEYIIDLFLYVFIGFVFVIKSIALMFVKFFKYFTIGVKALFDVIAGLFKNSKLKVVIKKPAATIKKEPLIKKKEEVVNTSKPIIPKLSITSKRFAALEEAKKDLQLELSANDVERFEERQIFKYTVKNEKGKIISGVFPGYSKLDVNSFLINEGYDVYKIGTSKWINFYYSKLDVSLGKMKSKDLIFLLDQLSTYIKSGIPLTNSVKILSNQMGRNITQKRILEAIVYELTMGESFSTALEKQSNVFPSLLINMVKAAEATGELEETLSDLSQYYNEVEKTRKQMSSALTYPTIILVFALGVVTFILLYVIPQFEKIYTQSNIEIKGVTSTIINMSYFLRDNVLSIFGVILVIIIGLVILFKKVKAVRKSLQTFAMKMPIMGKIIIYNEMTIFTKTFASLLKNNVYITESMDILSKITKNEIYREIMFNTINNIAKGEKISDAFKDQWAVPEVAYYMIVTGESTGELATMMSNVSNYYQEMHRNSVNSIKSLIEPIMIVLLAVIVGVVILAVIVPMFDLYSSIEM